MTGKAFVHTPVDLPIMIMMLLLPFNLLLSLDLTLTLPHVYKLIGGTVLFYGIVGFLQEKAWFRLSALSIHLLGGVLGLVLLFGTEWPQNTFTWLPFNVSNYLPQLVNPFWKSEDFKGFNANLAGGILALLLPVPMSYALFGERLWARCTSFIEVGALTFVLLFTHSRGAILAFGVAVLIMLVTYDRRWLVLVTILFIISMLFLLSDGASLTRLPIDPGDMKGGVQGLDMRIELWLRGIYIMQDFPISGIGMGMVEVVLPLLYPTFRIPASAEIHHVHNLYLQMGAEFGYPGLIVTLVLLFVLFAFGWQTVGAARDTNLFPLANGLVGVIVVFAVHGLVDVVSCSPKAYLITYALFGVSVGLALYLRDRCAV
jgi:O-antigen ligase